MAKKSYKISQTYKYMGETRIVSGTYECEEAELSAIVTLMEGNVKVYEENVTLSSPDTATEAITGGLPIASVSMVHSEAKTKFFSGYGKSFIFKASTSMVELQNAFLLHKPFEGAYAAEKPDKVFPKMGQFLN